MESMALQFILDAVPQAFHADTNVFVAGCFICLAWPRIEISADAQKVVIDCPADDACFPRDNTPLVPFLKQFPELCLDVVEAHPRLQRGFQNYCRSLRH
jgi:hypothetical protein